MAIRKKVLFIMPSLEGGGAEKSLVTLIGALDSRIYEVHLLLFEKKGIFLSALPNEVEIHEPVDVLKNFSKPLMESIDSLQRNNKVLLHKRIFHSLNTILTGEKVRQIQRSWNLVSGLVEVQEDHYDAVIGYMEMWPIYFAVEKISADIKIGVIHTNYTKYGMDRNFDVPYFNKLDHLLTVSEECKTSLVREFPLIADKISIIENITSEKDIILMAEQGDGFQDDFDGIRLLTIGRLDFNKGYDLAIEACAKLLGNGLKIRWYAIGTGPDGEKFMKMVKSIGLEDRFIFLGSVANPYPFLKQADLYIHPSRLEGKSLAVEEAKVLKKPIVVTAYENVKDQVIDELEGSIVEMNADSLAAGIEQMITDRQKREALINYLSSASFSNEKQVLETFDELMDRCLQRL